MPMASIIKEDDDREKTIDIDKDLNKKPGTKIVKSLNQDDDLINDV